MVEALPALFCRHLATLALYHSSYMHMSFPRLRRVVLLASLLGASCAHPSVRIEAGQDAKVDLIDSAAPNAVGTSKGKTPVDIASDELRGRVIRVSSPDKVPAYLYFADLTGEKVVAKIQLADLPAVSQKIVDDNLVFRMILRAYQELTANRADAAVQLAQKAADLRPNIAAPYIIKGMAELQRGAKVEAKRNFNQAEALDPADPRIKELVEMTQ